MQVVHGYPPTQPIDTFPNVNRSHLSQVQLICPKEFVLSGISKLECFVLLENVLQRDAKHFVWMVYMWLKYILP